MQTFELCQIKLKKMFMNPIIPFTFNAFFSIQAFANGKQETILLRWINDPNNMIDHLAFECQANHIWV
jgi:hypothetical protein